MKLQRKPKSIVYSLLIFCSAVLLIGAASKSEDASQLLKLAHERYEARDFTAAIRNAKLAAKDGRLSAWAKLIEGQSQEKRGALQEALNVFAAIPATSPASLDARVGALRVLVQKGRDGILPKITEDVPKLNLELSAARREDLQRELRILRGKLALMQHNPSPALAFFIAARSGLKDRELMQAAQQGSADAIEQLAAHGESIAIFNTLLQEAQRLIKENEPQSALAVLHSAKGRTHTDSSDFFAIELLEESALRALGNDKEADRLLALVASSANRESAEEALSRMIKRAWNKDDHKRTFAHIEEYRQQFGDSTRKDELTFIEATTLENEGLEAKAEILYRALVDSKHDSSFRLRALRRLAWSNYFKEQYAGAAKDFLFAAEATEKDLHDAVESAKEHYRATKEDTLSDTASARAKLKIVRDLLDEHTHHRYWLAASLTHLLKAERIDITKETPEEILSSIIALAPNSYYGMLAKGENPSMPLQSPRMQDCAFEITPKLEQTLAALQQAKLREYAQAEISWFLKGKSGAEGAREYAAAGGKQLTAADVQYFLSEIELGTRFGNPSRGTAIADSFFKRPLMLDPFEASAKSCASLFRTLAFPTPFPDAFQNAAQKNEVSAALLYAHAKTESYFDPLAQSPKDARGLMQLLRSTAEMEGFPKSGDLYDPMQNVFFGAKHLAGLLKRYDKKIPFAASAYNAGADATEKWRARFPTKDLEVWTEAITYPETRDYVKKIIFAKKMYDQILK